MKQQVTRIIFALIMGMVSILPSTAQETANAHQAKRIFNTAFNKIFGPVGAKFTYHINILGLYKEDGTSWNKGDKAKSVYKNSKMWNNGDVKYIVREKKRIIEVHDPKVNKKDEKLQMFKFDEKSYDYHIVKEGNDFKVTLQAKKGTEVKMKKVIAFIDPKNYHPKKLRIKVGIFWATITLANFQEGGFDDDIFEFHPEQFKGYKIVDER